MNWIIFHLEFQIWIDINTGKGVGCQSLVVTGNVFGIDTNLQLGCPVRARVSILIIWLLKEENAKISAKPSNLCRSYYMVPFSQGDPIVLCQYLLLWMDPPGNFKRRDLPRSLRRLTEHKSQVRPDHCRKRGIRFPPISCSNFSLIGVSMSFLLSKSQTSSETAQHQAPDFCTWRFSKSWLPTSATKRAAQGKSIGTNLHLWNHYCISKYIKYADGFFPVCCFFHDSNG